MVEEVIMKEEIKKIKAKCDEELVKRDFKLNKLEKKLIYKEIDIKDVQKFAMN